MARSVQQHFSKFSRQNSGNSSFSRKRPSHLLTGNASTLVRHDSTASNDRLTMNTFVRDLGGNISLDYSDLEPKSSPIPAKGDNSGYEYDKDGCSRPSRFKTVTKRL
eukprot:CAMPEP_0196823590 /NCGR_PEP_ID=MMETSP1362-20130617/88090_1 /TAXON_ID=163516 /ORGANISM="Leptocylindrus danicus, Strain CCMP1856" /LENGTH=106 /DNA_ID=CAMNT_0042203505 /DNA_START=6 /DNA_END=323 /DNA_ORIENTATION=+